MTIATQITPTSIEEVFEGKDRDEIARIINDLHHTYQERMHHAQREYHQALRTVNRATHEVHRLERHLERMQDFCDKHNITIGA